VTEAVSMHGPLRNLGWLLGGRGVNAVLSLIYLTLATRSLGLTDFGRFTLIVVMAQAITGVVSFSTWQAVVKWGALEGETGRAAGFAVALDLASVVCGGIVAAGAVWIAPLWLPLPPELRPQAFALCLASLLAIRSTPTGLLRLHDRYDLAAAAEAALPATRAAGAVAAALLFPRIGGFIAAWALAELVSAAAYWCFAVPLTAMKLSDVSLRALPRAHPGVWRFVWATNLSRSLAVSSKQVLLLLVGALGGAALAGAFRVASQIGQAMVQLGEAVSRSIYPELIRAGESAGTIARKVALLSAGGGALAILVAALLGKWGLGLIAGPEFAFAAGAMTILVAGGALELVSASWDTLLVARGKAELPFVLRLLPLIVALVLLPSAIAADGLRGAALCLLLASTLTALGLGYVALFRGDKR
jgi:O-antigen/teichoic acid export membrane protein